VHPKPAERYFMATFDVLNLEKQKVSTIDLADIVFAGEVNENLFYEVIKSQLASRRAGTHAVKNRSLVSGGGKKPYKQKGTGRARQGSIRASHWVGGGKAMGPKPRDYSYDVPKQVRKGALRSALALRAKEHKIFILENFTLSEIKTQKALAALEKLGIANALIVDASANQNLAKSVRNLDNYSFLPPEGLNLFDVLKHHAIVLTVPTAKTIEERLS
jgi:large subunit ribosomal protein L4